MAQNEKKPPDTKSVGQSPPVKATTQARTHDPLRRLLDAAEGKNGHRITAANEDACEVLTRTAAGVLDAPGDLEAFQDFVCALVKQLQQLSATDRVLNDMHDRNRELTEQFFEREVFDPILLGVIGIIDRCITQVRNIQQSLIRAGQQADEHAKNALQHIAEARAADRTELENLLARHAVESYEHPGEEFDPAVQKALKRVPCKNPALDRRIARRVLPGYTRHGRVLRAEYVMTYVHGAPAKTTEK